MTATAAHKRQVADATAGFGNKVTYHSGDPGTTGANLITTTPASANTTWAAAVDGAGGDAGKAVATGSAVNLQVPASTVVAYYGVWNGSTFLRGEPMDSGGVTVNAGGPVPIDCTPKIKVSM